MRFFRPVPRLSLAQPADCEPLAGLYAASRKMGGALGEPCPDPAEIRVWLRGGFEVYAASLEGRLVGGVRCCFPVSTCYFDRLVVAPEERGRGFGRYLVEHVLSRARRVGVTQVWTTAAPAEEALVGVLSHLGFRIAVRCPGASSGDELLLLECAP